MRIDDGRRKDGASDPRSTVCNLTDAPVRVQLTLNPNVIERTDRQKSWKGAKKNGEKKRLQQGGDSNSCLS